MHQQQTAFENIVGKGEISRYKQFLLFSQCFLLYQVIVSLFVHIFDIIPLFTAEMEKPKIGKSGRGINLCQLNDNSHSINPDLFCSFCWKTYTHRQK